MNKAFLNTSLETFRALAKKELTAMAFGKPTQSAHAAILEQAFAMTEDDLSPLNNTQKHISAQRAVSELFRLFYISPLGTTIPTTLEDFKVTVN